MTTGVSTEWEDIQVKLGNYLPRDKDPTNDELEKIAIETVDKFDPLEKKNLDELKELEDDEDDEVLKEYMEKRMQEMKEYAQKPKYGKVLELRKQDYIREVTNALN
jgi:glutamyl-tRNA reductase